jgi:hypothetical protein
MYKVIKQIQVYAQMIINGGITDLLMGSGFGSGKNLLKFFEKQFERTKRDFLIKTTCMPAKVKKTCS